MSTNVIQSSLASGELSTSLHARVDLTAYHAGVALMRNWFVDYRGGASTRPGTRFVAQCGFSGAAVRLVPFQFSTIQNYILEFGDHYLRIILSDGPVILAPQIVSNITNDIPAQMTVIAHGLTTGDAIYLETFGGGMLQLNQRSFLVSVIDVDHFIPTTYQGELIDTRTYAPFTGGTISKIYEVTSPYAAADLALLKYTQSADVITFTHPDYPIYNLIRHSNTNWTFDAVVVGSTIAAPGGLSTVVFGGAGLASYAYVVTAVDAAGNESIASAVADVVNAVDISATAGAIEFAWGAVAGAVSYNVYKANPAANLGGNAIPSGAQFGFMGTTVGIQIIDTNIVPDFTFTPPTHRDPFAGANYPSAVAYYQQRKVYGGSIANPETFWMSQTGIFDNFDTSSPTISSDAITGTLVSRQVNSIKYMISLPGGLVTLTGGGAWQISGGSGANSPVTPSSIVATPQAYNGCADIEPITINYDVLYVQAKGSIVRDLSYSFYTNIYTGTDLTVLSNHFFTGHTIKGWAYAEEPYKIIWAARDDGRFLSLTYLKEQEIKGWAQHETQGLVESVASIPEGTKDGVYFVVERKLRDFTVKYIERLEDREFPYGVEDAWCVDAGLKTSPSFTSSSVQLFPLDADFSGLTTISSDPGTFVVGHVGFTLRVAGGIFTVTNYLAPTVIEATCLRVPTGVIDGAPMIFASDEWSLDPSVSILYGLSHLDGWEVAILGDGNVFPNQTVVDGTITLSQPCSKIIVGVPFVPDLQTLDLDVGEPTIQGKRKNIAALTLRLDKSRGLSVGPTFDDLVEIKERSTQPMGQPIPLISGDERLTMRQYFNEEGRICIRQSYPLPATVLGIIPEIVLGDK